MTMKTSDKQYDKTGVKTADNSYHHDPTYLHDLRCPTLGTRGRSSLRSIEQGVLSFPFAGTSTRQACAFLVVDPSVWNRLSLA